MTCPIAAELDQPAPPVEIDKWMAGWMETKSLTTPLYLSRFVEPIYFLIEPIGWKPDSGKTLKAVTVPKGFVTDLASIPRIFFSLLRPDGEYTYPAIIHDYLYWMQQGTRKDADQIFKLGMEALEIQPSIVSTIYQAVSRFGQSAWASNAELKSRGERRILRRFPNSPATRWAEWKTKRDVFL